MNDTPTNGPISASITHQDRELSSSRHSFLKSHFQALLREGKEDLLEVRWQVMAHMLARQGDEDLKGAFSDNAAVSQEHEAVANLRRVGDLVNGQEERAIRREMLAQRCGRFAALAQIQPLKGLVDQEDRLGGKQPKRQQGPFALSLR